MMRAVLVLGAWVLATVAVPAMAATLTKETDARLALMRARNMPAAAFAVISAKGSNARVAATVKHLGGRVRYRFDGIDYISATLPLDRVETFISLAAIESLALDVPFENYVYYSGLMSAHDQQAEGAAPSSTPWPPLLTDRPINPPYSILKDMDGERLRAESPTYDGRGVVIAQVEAFGDFLLPELQTARDINGRSVPKLLDVILVPELAPTLDEEPRHLGSDWVRLDQPVKSVHGEAVFKGQRYRLPGRGEYRFGEFVMPNEAPYTNSNTFRELSKVYGTEKRILDKKEKSVVALVTVWSEKEQTLRIDTDRDGDLTDEEPVALFARSGQLGILGRDDPQTAIRETVGFALQKKGNYLGIYLGDGGHASMVAGAAAANRGEKGRVDGVAPGAQVIVVDHGSRATSFAEALIVAACDPRTDVILVEGRNPVTALHELKDGRSTLGLVMSRLVERYRKPLLFTPFNAPGMSTVEDESLPTNVMAVGAYQSAASVFAQIGIKVRRQDDLHWVGSEGPAGDGALKPDFLSPANPMTLGVSFGNESYRLFGGIFQLPPGYGIGSGTSTATPVATGAAAVLVSAAKQKGIAWDAASIQRAMRSSARYLPEFPAYQQGRGVIQIGAAWRELQAGVMHPAVRIEVDAPVNTRTAHLLPNPNRGRGLFEREGWNAGDSARRTVMLTRTSGPREPMAFDVQWTGNEAGTFSSAARVTLPLNQPTPFAIAVNPKAPEAYSAFARLHNPSVSEDAIVPATVVVPYVFTADEGYVAQVSLKLERPGRRNLFFRVPAGVAAFTVEMATNREAILGRLYTPDNRQAGMLKRVDGSALARATIARPMEGVWQLVLHDMADSKTFDWAARDQEFLPQTPVQVKASIYAASIQAQSESIALENRFAETTAKALGYVGAVRTIEGALNAREHRVFEIQVENGAQLLMAQVQPKEGENLDVDLYLYDCTQGDCLPARYGVSYGSSERVLIERPRAGAWKAIISSQGARAGRTAFVYKDLYTHPRLGGLLVADADLKRGSAQHWSAQTHLWRAERPVDGREAVGAIVVRDLALNAAYKPIETPADMFGKYVPAEDFVPLALELLALP